MYPTLIIILCALDKSLHERSHNAARRSHLSAPAFAPPLGRQTISGLSDDCAFPASPSDNPSSTVQGGTMHSYASPSESTDVEESRDGSRLDGRRIGEKLSFVSSCQESMSTGKV